MTETVPLLSEEDVFAWAVSVKLPLFEPLLVLMFSQVGLLTVHETLDVTVIVRVAPPAAAMLVQSVVGDMASNGVALVTVKVKETLLLPALPVVTLTVPVYVPAASPVFVRTLNQSDPSSSGGTVDSVCTRISNAFDPDIILALTPVNEPGPKLSISISRVSELYPTAAEEKVTPSGGKSAQLGVPPPPADGVTEAELLALPAPMLLTARTWKTYVVPFVMLLKVTLVDKPLSAVHADHEEPPFVLYLYS